MVKWYTREAERETLRLLEYMLKSLRTEVIRATIKLWRADIAIADHPLYPQCVTCFEHHVDGVRISVHKPVLTWFRGFQDKLLFFFYLYFVLFSLCPSVFGN